MDTHHLTGPRMPRVSHLNIAKNRGIVGVLSFTYTIVLDRHRGARARFDVRSTNRDGSIHIQFSTMEPAFEQALNVLLGPPREARRA